ncbi:hypothetical protein [Flavilitoribacter nigricans]|uniref:Uncharacterized protein n=1 Tax=Flavilitoribacter nigricans (strain ATCC 23147 / DSM 23189 / NBRC 102662 / NCIMB 1420 / SS-2) TaxID=1122177 RepID=A0A2D0MWQ3_FLAN2|nr:hypothetical protein [Flavilitoribacter nigricans]PHN00665.1 hypothetical protein CRP01_41120 [Flavilitoribacter nigricans DSM 23189 = NBRC 102662]
MATKTLTKAQWKQFEGEIWKYKSPALLIDDHIISVRFIIDKKAMRVLYEVFIDGEIKGEWIGDENELAKKYWFARSRNPFLSMAREREKMLGKRLSKKIGMSVEDAKSQAIIIYQPWFSSFKTMKSTWERNNDSIELYHENKES